MAWKLYQTSSKHASLENSRLEPDSIPEILDMLEEYRESRSIYVLHSHQETEDFIQTLKQIQRFSLTR